MLTQLFQKLVTTLVLSYLDYGYVVFTRRSAHQLWRLQSILVASAQLIIFGLHRSDLIRLVTEFSSVAEADTESRHATVQSTGDA